MVVFDASFLIYFLDPKIKGGIGSNPNIDHLVATIQKTGERIAVPTPALSELLVKAGDAGPKYLEIVARSKFFRIAEFGERAAGRRPHFTAKPRQKETSVARRRRRSGQRSSSIGRLSRSRAWSAPR